MHRTLLAAGPQSSRSKRGGTCPVSWNIWRGQGGLKKREWSPCKLHAAPWRGALPEVRVPSWGLHPTAPPAVAALPQWLQGTRHQRDWYLITLNPHTPSMTCSSYYCELPEGSRHLAEMTSSVLRRGEKKKIKSKKTFRVFLNLTST